MVKKSSIIPDPYTIGILLISIVYGATLASFPVDLFIDRENYLNYIDNSSFILYNNAEIGVFRLLSNEPLWLLLNAFLALFLDSAEAVRIYIFIGAVAFSFYFLKEDQKNFWWLLLFLFAPQIIKNYIVHLRQGVAIAVFMVGWTASSKKTKWTLLSLTPFMHASFFFILFIYIITRWIKRMPLSYGINSVLLILVSGVLLSSLGLVAVTIDARQAGEYKKVVEGISGFGFIYWSFVLMLFVWQGGKFLRDYSFEVGIIVFYLIAYFFVGVSARVFESGLPFVLLATLVMKGKGRPMFLMSFLLYVILSWTLRLNEPYLGFGV